MDINCPYCGTRYELDESLIPDGDIKVKCRVCSNIFILNKKTGASKNEPKFSAYASNDDKDINSEKASNISNIPDISDDFMKSIISEINSAVAEETNQHDKNKNSKHKKASVTNRTSNKNSDRKGASPFQISMIIVLAVILLVAAVFVLVHYDIINTGFLPPNVSKILSSF